MLQKLLCLVLITILLPCRISAWGYTGHQIVAELAMNHLSDATRKKVEQVLNGMTPAQAGNWMDEVRSDQAYRYTAPWHFVNIEPGESYTPAASGDIITALNKAYTELQYREKLSPEQVKFDVLVLFHLCGDLLQPLHVGYGSDKGGNTYQVQYNGQGTSLHSIWDTRIIESQGITLTDLEATSTSKQKQINFMDWLNESRALLPQVYDMKGHKLDDSYMQKNKAVVETQLQDGAILLASCLENIFSNVTNIPVALTPAASSGSQTPAKAGNANTGTITADQAAAHIGETVTVCGKVYSTKFLNNGPTFINMGGAYPDNPFTAVIMFNKRVSFSYKPEDYLSGKTICVTGAVKNHKGKPEIVVNKEEQINIQ